MNIKESWGNKKMAKQFFIEMKCFFLASLKQTTQRWHLTQRQYEVQSCVLKYMMASSSFAKQSDWSVHYFYYWVVEGCCSARLKNWAFDCFVIRAGSYSDWGVTHK